MDSAAASSEGTRSGMLSQRVGHEDGRRAPGRRWGWSYGDRLKTGAVVSGGAEEAEGKVG